MKNILLLIITLLTSLISLAQTVKSIEAKAVDNKIEVSYKITGLKYYQNISAVNLYVKETSDKSFQGPMEFISGDTKSGLRNGEFTIYWDALKEMSIGEDQLVFDVKISVEEEDRSRKFFVGLVGNDVTPLGLRFGQIGKLSWYIEARASLYAKEKVDYTYSADGIIEYNDPGYYELTGKGAWQAYSAIIGITKQVHRNVYLYAGAGYGVENYILELNNYNYDNQEPISSSWAKLETYNEEGIEIDAGLIYQYKHLLLSAGGTSLNFKSFYWSASLGFSF